jgi:hypothetical protein
MNKNKINNFNIEQNFNIVPIDKNFQNINERDRLISQKFKIGNLFNNNIENNNNLNENLTNGNKNNNNSKIISTNSDNEQQTIEQNESVFENSISNLIDNEKDNKINKINNSNHKQSLIINNSNIETLQIVEPKNYSSNPVRKNLININNDNNNKYINILKSSVINKNIQDSINLKYELIKENSKLQPNLKISFLKRNSQNILTTTIYYELHNKYMKSILAQDGAFFEKFQSGDLLTRALGDINTVKFSAGNRLLNIFNESLTVIVTFVAMILINPILAICCFLPLSLILVSNIILRGKVKNNWKKVREKHSIMNNVVLESITNVRTIRAYSKEEENYQKNLKNLNMDLVLQ